MLFASVDGIYRCGMIASVGVGLLSTSCFRPAPPLEEGDNSGPSYTTHVESDGSKSIKGHPVVLKRLPEKTIVIQSVPSETPSLPAPIPTVHSATPTPSVSSSPSPTPEPDYGNSIELRKILSGRLYPVLAYNTYEGIWTSSSDVRNVWYSATIELTLPVDGNYRLTFHSDDDVRVTYNNELLINDTDGYSGPTVKKEKFFGKGYHQFQIEARNTIGRGFISSALFECLSSSSWLTINPLNLKEYLWNKSPEQVQYF